MPLLSGKTAIISGASQGLGLEIAKQFLIHGADILICARNAEMLAKAQEHLLSINQNSKVLSKIVDVSKQEDVTALITYAKNHFSKIDILVANAAVHGAKGPIDTVDWTEWCEAIDINLKGSVLQCRAVLPFFKKQKHGKIIILSGGGATKPMPNLSAYAASKAGIVRFAETLAEEVKEYGIDVNAVAPGALNTRLLDDILTAGPTKVGVSHFEQALNQKKNGGMSLTQAAELCAFLASDESNGITGKLISAAWDPWQKLAELKTALQNSDIYTLRRIVPEDRGLNWEL